MPEEQQNAINAVRELMNTYKTLAKEYGVLKSEQFIDDYIAHIFKNKPPTGKTLSSVKRSLGEVLVDTTNNAKVRTLNDTISGIAKKYPNLDIETDVFKILDGYKVEFKVNKKEKVTEILFIQPNGTFKANRVD